ncbi:MAG: cell envelope biogenesis protein OmpA, partial [Pseudomonadota bacterium]
FGVYSGGNPNVWLSNTYQATNTVQFGADGGDFGLEQNGGPSIFTLDYGMCEDGVPQGPGYCVPQLLIDAVATGTGSNFEINYLDPDYDLPADYKFSLGGTYLLPQDFVLSADILYSVLKDSAVWIRGDLVQTGTVTGPDGGTYPDYDQAPRSARSFVLTNSSDDAKSLLLSVGLNKSHDFGLDWAVGYAYSDAEDVHPMTSSVAFSNYVNRAFVDPQDVSAARSDYNIEHRFTALANYEKEFFQNAPTRFSAFGSLNSGRPYSITYNGEVSTGDIFGFTPFLDDAENTLYPGFSRNDQEGSWWGKVDIKIEQDIPVNVLGDDKASIYMVIDNFTNLLNDEWGILREVDFPATCEFGTPCESRIGDASRYEIRFGARYEF